MSFIIGHFFLFNISIKRYTIAIISNLPAIMLTIRNALETRSISIEVIPAVIPVVVKADTDSNRESRKSFCSVCHSTTAVTKETATKRTITITASLNVFSSLSFSVLGSYVLKELLYREDADDIDRVEVSAVNFLLVIFCAIWSILPTLIPPAVENAVPPISIRVIS